MIFLKKNNQNKGFSLLELILAVAIFSLASFAMATLLIDANISTKLAAERKEALSYAVGGISNIQALGGESFGNLVSGITEDSIYTDDVVPILKFNRTITISTSTDYSKLVSVSVSGAIDATHLASTTISTLLTNWRLR
jgi:prepilin-type N-terminal cleavage/methylation domain-containing protein